MLGVRVERYSKDEVGVGGAERVATTRVLEGKRGVRVAQTVRVGVD